MGEYLDIGYLIHKLVSYENKAWEYFLIEYSGLIRSYINRFIDTYQYKVSSETKTDIFYEVISLLLDKNCRRLKSIDNLNKASFCAWLKTVTTRHTLNFFRRKGKFDVIVDPSVIDPPPDFPVQDNRDKTLFLNELREIIIQKLEPRESLILFYRLDGLILKEIAELMEISIASASNYEKSGISKIRKYFKNSEKKLR